MARAPFACDPANSRGRRFAQGESAMRTAFQRDRDRIIHSSAFRRLKEKTQVFVAHEGDAYRTRLTHSLEVAQIARTLARALDVDEDLAEAAALAHDLGHPPFGHSGEDALQDAMSKFGGFDHNAQTLRVVTKLETRYPEFEGLNLAWETLEGVVKHNGPLMGAGEDAASLPWGFTAYEGWRDLELHTHAGVEAQIAALNAEGEAEEAEVKFAIAQETMQEKTKQQNSADMAQMRGGSEAGKGKPKGKRGTK
jgi:dGTPase